ncbi:TPA_asm: coat protein [ssRNA phage Gerhypos.4_22]|jgi:hypothetical protein|uniref:Coat protein n=2 Tax=Leviviricetes TaxID=2842243 RepID=A0A8S5L2A9_9VIRU|nr:coat protein [ssRNA phage Gerhypos.4_22]QDH87866.1 MAG: hypothetical protein H4Bulk46514_000003 [Leviviridae sp.]DAD51517.1 TPA_asm: coat protein [ssRNA phage Gerhypos.4_22]
MAFTDPQSITISAVTTPLPRTESGTGQSAYQSADGLIKLSASNAYGRRTRRVLRLDHSKLTPDPFIPAQNTRVSMSNYIVFDVPVAGYSNTEALAVYAGFKTAFTASSDALITKLLGGES